MDASRKEAVKKYHSHQDRTAILSVKTQHDEAGKQNRIKCKNHYSDHERIECFSKDSMLPSVRYLIVLYG